MDLLGPAGRALDWIFTSRGHMSVGTIPDGDTVAPPQLAADAPIFDILQPVEIDLLKALGHNLDTPISDGLEGSLRQRLDGHKPLRRDHRFDDFTAALGARDGGAIGLRLDDKTVFLHIRPYILARLKPVLTFVRTAIFID